MLESVNGVLKARLFELCELSLKIKTRLQNTWVFYNWFGYIIPILLKECTWKRKPIMFKMDYSLEVHNLSFQANKEEPEFFMKQIKIECLQKRLTFYLKLGRMYSGIPKLEELSIDISSFCVRTTTKQSTIIDKKDFFPYLYTYKKSFHVHIYILLCKILKEILFIFHWPNKHLLFGRV